MEQWTGDGQTSNSACSSEARKGHEIYYRCGLLTRTSWPAATCPLTLTDRPPPSMPTLAKVLNVGDGSADGGGLTVSVNTNWFNGFNLERVHAFLRSELSAVRAALDHLRAEMSPEGRGQQRGGRRDWERQCELVMRANSGLNVTDFARMVTARARYLLARDRCAVGGDPEEGIPGDAFSRSCPSPGAVAAVETGRALDSGRERREEFDEEAKGKSGSSGDSGGRGGDWEEQAWTTVALEQIAAVLRELSATPAIDHIFVGDDDDDRGFPNAGAATSTPDSEGEQPSCLGGVGEGGNSSDDLQETLQAVEAYLVRRRDPSGTPVPPNL